MKRTKTKADVSVESAPPGITRLFRHFANSRLGFKVTGSFSYPLRFRRKLCVPKMSSFLCPLLVINNNWGRTLWPWLSITNSLTRYFFIVRQIYEHNKCLLSSNYSSEKRYKEKRIERAEGTTTKAILLRTTSRDGAYIKVIVIRQTEYKGRAQWFMWPTRSIIVP